MRAAVTTTTTINYLDDPRKRVGREHEQWQAGTIVTTPEGGLRLIILRRIDDGHAGVVFKVRDDRGTILALKVPSLLPVIILYFYLFLFIYVYSFLILSSERNRKYNNDNNNKRLVLNNNNK